MNRSTLLPLPTHTPDVYEQVRETARRFADARIRPRANELDQSEALPIDIYEEMAGLGLFVAVQTLRGRRKFQPPMTTWYAAMLFAVVPLRNALPDSPPIGWWVDVTVVLWVIVALGISMLIYIYCWWRDLRPDP